MKELLTYIARSLVDDPDSVSVSQSETPAETGADALGGPAPGQEDFG